MFEVLLFELAIFFIHCQLVKVLIYFLFKFFSLSSKSIFLKKSAISPLLAKFACFNLAVKFSAVKLLNF